jgi:hypothetical protein
MKDQYFGDINDYKKYGLLRILSNDGEIKTAVCWMLTDADKRSDGRFVNYLQKPDRWRVFDPPLFDSLKNCFAGPGSRNVLWAETTNILPLAVFYDKLVSDNALDRQQCFSHFISIAQGSDLVFFDPDNGLEVKSVPYGRKYSSKYLYWHELLSTFKAGYSVLLYQHFRREKRTEFISNLAKTLSLQSGASEIISFRTSNVVFMLIPQAHHLDYFQQRGKVINVVWASEIQVAHHRSPENRPLHL